MLDFMLYDLKVAVLLAVFWLCWQLLAARETFHRLNRVVLLATAVLSLVLPLCVITVHRTVPAPPVVASATEALATQTRPVGPLGATTTIQQGVFGLLDEQTTFFLLVSMVYIVGALLCLMRTLYSIWSVRRMISHAQHHDAPQLERMAAGRVGVAVVEGDVMPFSWWRTIILNQADYAEGDMALLAHECGHIRNHHSADVIFVDVLTALQWFNPVVWLLRQDLRTIHEYEADAAVVSQGFNRYQYLQLLIRKAAGNGGYSVANGINDSTLKKRVTMMLKDKTPKRGWMRLLYVVPVVALSLAATAKTVVEYKAKTATGVSSSVEEKPFLSYSPTLVNRAHPQAGGAYVISVPKEFQNEIKDMIQNGPKKTGGSVQDMFLSEENGCYNVAYYKASTTMMLNGKEFDERSLPDLKAEDVLMMEGGIGPNGKSTLNFITNPYKLSDEDFRRWVHRQRMAGVKQGDLTQKLLNIGPMPRKHILMANDEYRNAKYNGKKAIDEVKGEDPIFNTPEKLPEFPGGAEKMMKFISENVKYPKEAVEKGLTGRVIVRFVVEKDGSLTNLEIMKSVEQGGQGGQQQAQQPQAGEVTVVGYAKSETTVSPSELLDEEALRVVRLMPKWQPAMEKGKVVRTHFTIPLIFRLN